MNLPLCRNPGLALLPARVRWGLVCWFCCWAAPAALAGEPTHDPRSLSGGRATVFLSNANAFGASHPELPIAQLREFAGGNSLFNTQWVAAPASVTHLDGLGPVFNASSCSACHTRDGRGRPPLKPGEPMTSMLVRLSIPGAGPHGGPNPHPRYGDQLNDRGILGVPAEGRCTITYTERPGRYPDGGAYSLRQPSYAFTDLTNGPLGDGLMFSPRVAPAVFGLGMLEAVADETLLAMADPEDRDGDGVSGRVNRVWDVARSTHALGRFGWKASQPSLRQQIAGAFLGDIGITSTLFPQENIAQGQLLAARAVHGGSPELSDEQLTRITLYNRALAVPARREVAHPEVQRGETLFRDIGCAACHVPSLRTGRHELDILSNQSIQPFTDLLLHDMGEDLADCREDFEAGGREWRTPPLWGLGLIQTVNRHRLLLHDGRARGVEEAILWHGGEGLNSRERFRQLPAPERAALLRFLDSL